VGGKVRIWSIATGVESTAFVAHDSDVVCLAFSPDGQLLVTADTGGAVRLWDATAKRKRRGQMDERIGRTVSALAFSPDGKRVAAGSSGEVRVWDIDANTVHAFQVQIPRGRSTATLEQTDAVAFSPDGRFLMAAGQSNPEIVIWELDSGNVARTLVPAP
jgi:WD40 repeat protein